MNYYDRWWLIPNLFFSIFGGWCGDIYLVASRESTKISWIKNIKFYFQFIFIFKLLLKYYIRLLFIFYGVSYTFFYLFKFIYYFKNSLGVNLELFKFIYSLKNSLGVKIWYFYLALYIVSFWKKKTTLIC